MNVFHEWMNEWMNEWMLERMNERLNEWMNVWTNEWMNECLNEWMNEWKNEWMNEGMIDHDLRHKRITRFAMIFVWQSLRFWEWVVCVTDRLTNQPTNQPTNAMEMSYRGARELLKRRRLKWVTTTKERTSCAIATNDEAAWKTIQP